MPEVTYFKPAGIPMRFLHEVQLSFEEIEALRLKDIEGLEQEQGAEQMNVSRPTFQRILTSARKKVTGAILNGNAIKIEGGNYEITQRRFRCHHGHEWGLETASITDPVFCPTCKTEDIQPVLAGSVCCDTGKNRLENSAF